MIQSPFKFAALCMLVGSVIPLVSSVTVKNADTPTFYLVSSSGTPNTNLLPVRLSGGAGGTLSLGGNGPIGQFYFYKGALVTTGSTPKTEVRVLMGSQPYPKGCTPYGQLEYSTSQSSYCAKNNGFEIQSDIHNSQLGASLAFNNGGGFYSCGPTKAIYYYKSGAPTTCSIVNLNTVPVYPP